MCCGVHDCRPSCRLPWLRLPDLSGKASLSLHESVCPESNRCDATMRAGGSLQVCLCTSAIRRPSPTQTNYHRNDPSTQGPTTPQNSRGVTTARAARAPKTARPKTARASGERPGRKPQLFAIDGRLSAHRTYNSMSRKKARPQRKHEGSAEKLVSELC